MKQRRQRKEALRRWVKDAAERRASKLDRHAHELRKASQSGNPSNVDQTIALAIDDLGQFWREPIYYRSGLHSPARIRALCRQQIPLGVTASTASTNGLDTISGYGRCGSGVFFDSGAFEESSFDESGRPYVKTPMTEQDWARVFDRYEAMASAINDRLVIVAPDKLGDQQGSLERLARWGVRLFDVRTEGAHILVPLVKDATGWSKAMGLADYERKALEAIDTHLAQQGVSFAQSDANGEPWHIPAIPVKKNATTLFELVQYMLSRHQPPAAMHLLGKGPWRHNGAPQMLAAISLLWPRCIVSMDSCWVRLKTGRSRKLEPLTACEDGVCINAVGDADGFDIGGELLTEQELIHNADQLLPQAQLARLGQSAGLDGAEAMRFALSPWRYIESSAANQRVKATLQKKLLGALRTAYTARGAAPIKRQIAIENLLRQEGQI